MHEWWCEGRKRITIFDLVFIATLTNHSGTRIPSFPRLTVGAVTRNVSPSLHGRVDLDEARAVGSSGGERV